MRGLSLAILLLAATGSVSAQEPVDENLEPAQLGLEQASGSPAAAPFAAAERRVRPGDEIFITDRQGQQTVGRIMRASPEELVILVGSEKRTVVPAAIGRVEKRDPVWNGALIGAVPFAFLGMFGAGASCSPDCARAVSLGATLSAGIGAGIGALIDRQVRGYAAVYGPGLAPPNAIRQGVPVGSLGELWTRVRQGDTVRVLTMRGEEVTGTLVRASAASISLLVGGQIQELPASEVRQVARRGNRYRLGALVSAALGGLGGARGACVSSSGKECAGYVVAGVAFGGMVGALWGAGIGALIPKHAVVFRSGLPAAVRVRVNPMIAPGGGGVALSLQF